MGHDPARVDDAGLGVADEDLVQLVLRERSDGLELVVDLPLLLHGLSQRLELFLGESLKVNLLSSARTDEQEVGAVLHAGCMEELHVSRPFLDRELRGRHRRSRRRPTQSRAHGLREVVQQRRSPSLSWRYFSRRLRSPLQTEADGQRDVVQQVAACIRRLRALTR